MKQIVIIKNIIDLSIVNKSNITGNLFGKIKNIKIVKSEEGYSFKLFGQLFQNLSKDETALLISKYY